MTLEQAVARIRNYRLSPRTLEELGLEEGWQNELSVELIADILNDVRRYGKVMEALK